MMKFSEYRDRVRACWLGKNIGGTLGGPLEGARGVFDITYYVHDISKGVLPNDDLDLQLVWLLAAEAAGRAVDSDVLGEYWITHIPCDWSEYGAGKVNLKNGIPAPVSGAYRNSYGEGTGAFIRSEIWACLNPGAPEQAVRYAFADASVDHTGNGVYGEIFCAAVESAAFAVSDIPTLLKIGLSFIPDDCIQAQCIRFVWDCYEKGMDYRETRKKLLLFNPSPFGLRKIYDRDAPEENPEPDIPKGEVGHDGATNVALSVIGLLYGEGDFTKSLCIAASCGEDTDCTAGFIGALLGILRGTAGIEKRWLEPIGDEIKTCTVDPSKSGIASTVTELTERVVRLMPSFLPERCSYPVGEEPEISFPAPETYFKPLKVGLFDYTDKRFFLRTEPLSVRARGAIYDAMLSFDAPEYIPGTPFAVKLTVWNKIWQQQWIRMKWYLPAGWTVSGGTEGWFYADQHSGKTALSEETFTLTPETACGGREEILLELCADGRPTRMWLPLTLFRKPAQKTDNAE